MHRRSIALCLTILAVALALGFWTARTHAQAPPAQPQPTIAPRITSGAAYGSAVDPPAPKKHILILGFTEGFHHGSTSDAIGTIWQMGNESGLYDSEIRTDTKWISKSNVGSGEAHNLDWYDAIVAVNTTGIWQVNDQQKEDFISAIRDDGKGFVAVHGALDTNRTGWPEYTEMVGGVFAAHPWIQFWAPVIIEDPSFPAMRHFPNTRMLIYDEMYVPRSDSWSRSKVNVLMRMDEDQLPAEPGSQQPFASYQALQAAGRAAAGGGAGRGGRGAPGGPGGPAGRGAAGAQGARRGGGAADAPARDNGIHPDKDYALAWSKMYGKGRVFYSSLGHTKLSWTQPDVKKMYLEGIKWTLGLTEGSTATHPKVK